MKKTLKLAMYVVKWWWWWYSTSR